jgi:hypothetical protein
VCYTIQGKSAEKAADTIQPSSSVDDFTVLILARRNRHPHEACKLSQRVVIGQNKVLGSPTAYESGASGKPGVAIDQAGICLDDISPVTNAKAARSVKLDENRYAGNKSS